jgi:hypothetical protein
VALGSKQQQEQLPEIRQATPARAAAPAPSQEDLEFTARKHGMTVAQVKQRLGVR